jgi:hypothetical protein
MLAPKEEQIFCHVYLLVKFPVLEKQKKGAVRPDIKTLLPTVELFDVHGLDPKQEIEIKEIIKAEHDDAVLSEDIEALVFKTELAIGEFITSANEEHPHFY